LSDIKFGIRIANVVAIGARTMTFRSTPYESIDRNAIKDTVLQCERLGYHSVWFPDHMMLGKARLECWSTLSAFSLMTEKIRLGSLVLCNLYRHPPLVAKMAATVDFLSNGRLEFGIGAGWEKEENKAYGMPFPKLSVRIAQLKEAIEIIKKMWTEEKPSHVGKYYNIEEAVCEPGPIQKPYPPITIGGGGERISKVIAEHADRCNYSGSVEECKQRLEYLEKQCSIVGRDSREINKSIFIDFLVYSDKKELEKANILTKAKYSWDQVLHMSGMDSLTRIPFICTPEECIEVIREYVDAGITFFMIRFEDMPSKSGMKLFAEKVMNKI